MDVDRVAAVAVDDLAVLGSRRRPVLGMDQGDIGFQAGRRIVGYAKHRAQLGRPMIEIGDQVDVGDAKTSGIGCQAKTLLAQAKRLFRPLAIGQVEHRPDRTDDLALLVANQSAAVEHLRIRAVGAAEAIFRSEPVRRPGHRGGDRRGHACPIIRMDTVFPPRPAALGRFRPQAETALERLAPSHDVAHHVEVPANIVRGLQGQQVAVACGARLVFDQYCVVNILGRTVPADDRAGGIPARAAARAHPSIRAGGDAHAIAHVVGRSRHQHVAHRRAHPFDVVGMHEIQPGALERLGVGQANELAPSLAELEHLSSRIGAPRHVGIELEHAAGVRFAFAQRRLGRLGPGHVDEHVDRPGYAARRIAEEHREVSDNYPTAVGALHDPFRVGDVAADRERGRRWNPVVRHRSAVHGENAQRPAISVDVRHRPPTPQPHCGAVEKGDAPLAIGGVDRNRQHLEEGEVWQRAPQSLEDSPLEVRQRVNIGPRSGRLQRRHSRGSPALKRLLHCPARP